MRSLRALDRVYLPIICLFAILVSMNLWMIVTTLLRIPASPFNAMVTNLLAGLYIVGVPVVGVGIVILTTCRIALKRISRSTALIQLGSVAAFLIFWGWSLKHSYLP